jgi:translation elongation factor EF-1alpha
MCSPLMSVPLCICTRTMQRDAAAAGKASFAWAWMLDERQEERARGVTVDVAHARSVPLSSHFIPLFCSLLEG